MTVAQTLALHPRDLGILRTQSVIFPLPAGLNFKEFKVIAVRSSFNLTM